MIVATVGANIIDSDDENDFIEDHNGQSLLVGGAANDTLVSRGGRDALWGGNDFMYNMCVDRTWPNDGTDDIPDANGETDCTEYETDPTICGVYDVFDPDDFFMSVFAGSICCICGGGSASSANTITTENADTDLSTGNFTLGDQDLYVIYPTTEKPLLDKGSARSIDNVAIAEWPNTGDNTKARLNECTKVYGLETQDTIQLRLDDPTVEDAKFTNDDDECAIEIDGWEIIWRLGDAWTDGTTSLDVHFSRKEMRAVICAFDDTNNVRTPVAAGNDGSDNMARFEALVPTECTIPLELGKVADDCFEVAIECPDLDPWPETDVDEYLKNKNILSWYGWGW